MDRKNVVYSALLALAIVALLIYLFFMKKTTASTSTAPTSIPPTSAAPTSCSTSSSQQPFIIKDYSLSQAGNILIPLLSENFVISAAPLSPTTTSSTSSVGVSIWFNIENDTNLHNDSLIINETPVTITQDTPIVLSDSLKQNGVPYQGYPYLVIASSGPLSIKAAFFLGTG